MGWAFGVNSEGREVGYSVSAVCDKHGCEAAIDRGLGYVCGGMHDGDEHGCGRYFCGEHLVYVMSSEDVPQLCEACAADYEREHPDEVEEGRTEFEARVEAMSGEQEEDGDAS